MNNKQYLECQDCGRVIRELTPAEAQRVARNPYNFIVYCPECKERNFKELYSGRNTSRSE